jgi:hypothetical protein
LHEELFKNCVEIEAIRLEENRITDIHPSTFYNNRRVNYLNLSGNKIISIELETFDQNRELQWLYLERNSISNISRSTFRNNSRLCHLDISRNEINLINPDTFVNNKKLTFLYLRGNKITVISSSSFRRLEQLEELDLSNNNIEDLNPLVFHNTLNRTNRPNVKGSKVKRLNVAQNKIRSFNFELYFPMRSNFDSSNPTLQLEHLNMRSNRLTTLDVASVKWLNQTTAVTDLTANPWNCDCSVLLEVWRGLKHKLKLHCASSRQLQGKSWDVMEEFCSPVAVKKPNKFEGRYAVTTPLIVVGVLLICAICGGLVLDKLVKRMKDKQKTPEYCDVYAPISLHSYAEVGAGPSHVTDPSYADVGKRSSYITVLSQVDVGSDSSNATRHVNPYPANVEKRVSS